MPEEIAAVESVTSPDASVAVDPALLNKPQRPEENTSNGDDLLKHKLGLANQHAKKAKSEAEEYRKQLDSLQSEMAALKEAQQSAIRENLEGQGAFKELYEQERQRAQELQTRLLNETSELKAELASVTQGAEQARLRATALEQISRSNAVNPQQLYQLLQSQIRVDDEGSPVVLSSGVEQPLGDYLVNLKAATEWQHHFSASAAKGMGASAASVSVAPGMTNPYRAGTRNLTEAMKLEVTNPELAKQLKAEALSGS